MSAPTPARRPAVTWPSLLLGIGLVALGVVGVRDLAVAQGWATGSSWTEATVQAADGLSATVATTAAGVALVLVGLALVVTVLRPASRTHLRTPSSEAEVWISRRAVTALVEQAVERVPGVHEVSARTSRRLSVRVATTDPDAEPNVREAIDRAVGGYLKQAPKISIRKATP